jgi:hypothetical protein
MADVDHLYGLPLEEFTPARDAAAKEIRKAGDRETAAVVAKLPKPTPAAWTANQVAREQPELIEAMLDAGAALREAQETAVSGGGGRGLREATLAERAAVDAIMTAAVTYRPAGRPLSRAMADRLRTTLHAAAGDESLREALAEGRLVDEAQGGGAWPFALEPAPPEEKGAAKAKRAGAKTSGDDRAGAAMKAGPAAGAATTKRGPAKTDDDARERTAAAKQEAAERAEREAAEQAEREARKALEAELREARGSLRVRERVFAAAEQDAEQAAGAAAEAKAALEQAQRAAQDAEAEAEAAARVAAEARNALDEARDDVARLEERLD